MQKLVPLAACASLTSSKIPSHWPGVRKKKPSLVTWLLPHPTVAHTPQSQGPSPETQTPTHFKVQHTPTDGRRDRSDLCRCFWPRGFSPLRFTAGHRVHCQLVHPERQHQECPLYSHSENRYYSNSFVIHVIVNLFNVWTHLYLIYLNNEYKV